MSNGATNLPNGSDTVVIPSATVEVPSSTTIVDSSDKDEDKVVELPLTPTQRVGFELAKCILWIICGCLVLIFGLLIFTSFDAYNNIKLSNPSLADSAFNHQKEIIKALQEEKKSYRDFIVQMSQMILLNLLLPTLTAVLGYIFGSKENAVHVPEKG